MTSPTIAELKVLYRDGRLLPFVGAGISMGVTWIENGTEKRGPSWRELVDEAARKLGFTDPNLLRVRGEDLQILEYYRQKNHGQLAPLSNWLLRELRPPDDALRASPVHGSLAALDNCRIIYTTNFDDFLERAFALHGRSYKRIAIEPHVAESLQRGGTSLHTEIVKFHGDLENPDKMVVSESDYRDRLRLATPMDARLRADALGRAILFVGYSFRDWNVSYLFHLVNSDFGVLSPPNNGKRAYITVADPSDFEYQLFQARNIDVIPLSGQRMSEDLALRLKEIAVP